MVVVTAAAYAACHERDPFSHSLGRTLEIIVSRRTDDGRRERSVDTIRSQFYFMQIRSNYGNMNQLTFGCKLDWIVFFYFFLFFF